MSRLLVVCEEAEKMYWKLFAFGSLKRIKLDCLNMECTLNLINALPKNEG
jgi:hypothetical protein